MLPPMPTIKMPTDTMVDFEGSRKNEGKNGRQCQIDAVGGRNLDFRLELQSGLAQFGLAPPFITSLPPKIKQLSRSTFPFHFLPFWYRRLGMLQIVP